MAESKGSNFLIWAALGVGAYVLYRQLSKPPEGEFVPPSQGRDGSSPPAGMPPGTGPGTTPGTGPGTTPGPGAGARPGPGSGTAPGPGSGTAPGSGGGGAAAAEQQIIDRIRSMAAQHGRSTYNVHEWNWFYQQATGKQGPAPEDIGAGHTEQMSFDVWWQKLKAWQSGSVSGSSAGTSLADRILSAARSYSRQQDPSFTADEWNWFYTSVTGKAAPAAEDYGFTGDLRFAKVKFSEWWSKFTSAGFGLSGRGPLDRWPFVIRSPWEV